MAPRISTKMGQTFFVSDRRMLRHKCEWDENHIEKPERLGAILDLFEKDGILGQCELLESKKCSIEELRLVHTQEHIDQIQWASSRRNLEEMEKFAANNEDIYVNAHSWESALLSAGCAIEAMEAVVNAVKVNPAESQLAAPNAFAAIRPPGHHASQNEPCGFCLFNNVAICAKKARMMGIQRVLILDWDIHAGQGTQYCIEGDPGIKLISAHRFEEGHFWPELEESGIMHKYKNTINVPLDGIGYGDAEYAAILHFLVLSLIEEWKPELLLISCGFDAALGDPEGEMEITPAGYGYMTGILAQLGVPLCVLLEGGYFVPVVAQSALFCMRALVQKEPPLLNFCNRPPSPNFLRTLFSVLLAHSSEFAMFDSIINLHNKFRFGRSVLFSPRKRRQMMPIKMASGKYRGERHVPIPNPTRNVYARRDGHIENYFARRLQQLLDEYKNGPIEREQLEIRIVHGSIRIMANNGLEFICDFQARKREDFSLILHNLLMPLAFTYFDVRLGDQQLLGMNWKEIDEFANGILPAAAIESGLELTDFLELFVDKFPMMKHFYFF